MKHTAEKFWAGLLYGLLGVALVSPLFVTSHLVGNLVFIKLSLFHIAVELGVLVWLVLLATNPARYAFRTSKLSWAVMALLGVLTLTTIFSVNPWLSFWGDISRFSGLWTYLHLGAFYFILISVAQTKREWLRLLKTIIVVGLLVALYSLLQHLGFDFVRQATNDRLIGPMSNAIELAGYSAIVAILSLGYAIKTRYLVWKITAGTTFGLLVVVVWLAGSAGGWLALVAGLGILILYYIWTYLRCPFNWMVAGTLILVGMVGGGWYLYQDTQNDISAQTRLHAWQVAMDASTAKPIVGYGLENFSIAYQTHYQPFIEKYLASDVDPETWFDRAHNSFLDYLVMAGVVGLAAYLALLWFGALGALSSRPKWRQRLRIMLLATLVVYITFNLTAFDFGSNLIIWFAVLGLVGAGTANRATSSTIRWGYLWLAPVVLVGLIVSAKLVYANRVAGRALAAMASGDFEDGTVRAERVTQTSTFVASNLAAKFLELGGGLAARTSSEHISKLDYFAKFYETHTRQPLNGQYAFVLGNYYRELAKVDSQFESQALAAYARSLELAPRRPLTHIVLGEAYLRYNRPEVALQQFQAAVAVLPQKASSYFWLSVGYINLGQVEPSLEAYRQAGELGFKASVSELNLLRNLYHKAGAGSRFDTITQ